MSEERKGILPDAESQLHSMLDAWNTEYEASREALGMSSSSSDEEVTPDECVPLRTLEDFMGKSDYAVYQKNVKAAEDEIREMKMVKEGPKKKFRNRPLEDTKVVFQENAWDDIEWDENQKAEAKKKVEQHSKDLVDELQRMTLEEKAAENWTKFYKVHQNKFFKKRSWLFTEFPDFVGPLGSSVDPSVAVIETKKKRRNESFPGENSGFRILEVGCGNGSTVIPLLMYNNHPETYVYCCDFSPQAVEIVASSPELDKSRCTPFVWDITAENPNLPFPPESLDVISIIFVLSAISPEKFDQVFQNLHKILKPGGLILFRDYGVHDLVQLRMKPGHCISDNFYFRGDGTRVYFFTEGEVEEMFLRNDYAKLSTFTDKRLQVNRLKQIKMYRVWIQGRFQKPSLPSSLCQKTGNQSAI